MGRGKNGSKLVLNIAFAWHITLLTYASNTPICYARVSDMSYENVLSDGYYVLTLDYEENVPYRFNGELKI